MSEENGRHLTEAREYMRIKPIRNGTVIDHLPPGAGLFVLNLLDYKELRVTPGLNYTSERLPEGKKDIIYMEGGILTPDQIGAISVIAPNSTINQIVDGEVKEKLSPVPTPEELGDILLCSNQKCTTNTEGGSRLFRVVNPPSDDEPFRVQCKYCEKEFYGRLVRFYTGQTLEDFRGGRFYFKK